MPEERRGEADRPLRRRWHFADAVFDEATWSLTVAGERVAIEKKPLELLRELLMRGGAVASKHELLDLIWPDVTVVEASLTTAIYKLRVALGDDGRGPPIIETVPGIGYRLVVAVGQEGHAAASALPVRPDAGALPVPDREFPDAARPAVARRRVRLPILVGISCALALATAAILVTIGGLKQGVAANAPQSYSQRDAANALRRLDVDDIETMLAAGWDPNVPFDREGNGALNHLLNMCEWNRAHDRQRLLLMVRTLFDGGARLDRRNAWGDTPYSIAKAERYCGPDHPVTQMMRTLCFSGSSPMGDRCLASYELDRRTGQ